MGQAADITLRRQNKTNEQNEVVGVEYYTLNIKGTESADAVLVRVSPELLRGAFADVIEDEVKSRLSVFRDDIEKAVTAAKDGVDNVRLGFMDSLRGWEHRVGIGRRPAKVVEEDG